jgi:hypothetical protein
VNTLETTTASTAAHELTESERNRARLYLDQTRSGIAGAIGSLSEPQWTFKPVRDIWSIAEIVEHVLVVQELVLGRLHEQIEKGVGGPPHPDYQRIDDLILYKFPNRLDKFPSPRQPEGGLARCEALARLAANHARFQQLVDSTPGLRQYSGASAPLKAVSNGMYESMDGYQFVLAAAAHTERHTKQILEVMAGEGYPA